MSRNPAATSPTGETPPGSATAKPSQPSKKPSTTQRKCVPSFTHLKAQIHTRHGHTRASRGGVRSRAVTQPEHESRACDALSRPRPTARSSAHRRPRPARRRRVGRRRISRSTRALPTRSVCAAFCAGWNASASRHLPSATLSREFTSRSRAPPSPPTKNAGRSSKPRARTSVSSCSSAPIWPSPPHRRPHMRRELATRTFARSRSTPRATCTKRCQSAPRSRT